MTTRPTFEFPVIRVSGFGQHGASSQNNRALQVARSTAMGSVMASQSKNQAGVPSHHITFSPQMASNPGIVTQALDWFKRGAPNEKIIGVEGSAAFKDSVTAAAKSLKIPVALPSGNAEPMRPTVTVQPVAPQLSPAVTA